MLFHSSLRRELAHSFGASLVVLFTIVLTMLLIRTLGLASRGSVNPEEIMLVLGYTVLGRMPTVLTLALFIAIVFTLSRLHRDSEMIIWHTSGRSLGNFVRPVMRFAWPVLAAVFLMVIFVWPWANQQTEELRNRFEQRGDLERVMPGQFQESSNNQRVFFIDKDTADGSEGRNVFISSREGDGREIITSARAGRVDWIDNQQILLLENGQRLESAADRSTLKISEFGEYATVLNQTINLRGGEQMLKARSTWRLISEPSSAHLGELGWRLGMGLAAFNLVLIALATTTGNPRAGRGGNLCFTLFAFMFYYNLLNLGQSWTAAGRVDPWTFMLSLHGGVFMLTILWLAKRHHNVSLRRWLLSLSRAWFSPALETT